MPTPTNKETRKEFVSRCVPIVLHEGTTKDPSQAAAICYSKWKEYKKNTRADWTEEVDDLESAIQDLLRPESAKVEDKSK